jgi:hypothetical protein
MTFCQPTCGPGGAKALEPSSWAAPAQCLTFSLDLAFAPEGLHVGRSFIANDSG